MNEVCESVCSNLNDSESLAIAMDVCLVLGTVYVSLLLVKAVHNVVNLENII